jgi:circadian clock protein KaiB
MVINALRRRGRLTCKMGKASLARYVLRLFVNDETPRSKVAISSVRRVCREHLADRFDLKVIDICLHAREAVAAQIVAAPTLIRERPGPLKRIIGDLGDVDRLVIALGL